MISFYAECEHAKQKFPTFAQELFSKRIESVESLLPTEVEVLWDGGVPENWAIFEQKGVLLGYLFAEAPIFVCLERPPEPSLARIGSISNLVKIPDWDTQIFVDVKQYLATRGSVVGTNDHSDVHSMSDIYYLTVSS